MSVIIVLIILSLLFFQVFAVETDDDCKPTRCKKHGPVIQFPFRDKNQRPANCGYPGFDVFCDERKETMLVLPLSVHVAVKKINYVSQQLHLYDPQKCLTRKLPYLNLSASPFNFTFLPLDDYILFNCSSASSSGLYNLIPCLGDSTRNFFAIASGIDMGLLPLDSCTRIHEISSVPPDIFHKNDLHLNWSEPACGDCEAQGKRCGLNDSINSTRGRYQIQCVDKPNTNQGASKRHLVAGVTLGSVLAVIALVAVVFLFISIRADKENRVIIEKFLEDHKALKPTRFTYSDIKRITLKFREKLGEGGYGTVYKGKLSNEINVAVKVLNNSKGNGEEFINEVSTIGRIHHVNIVRLVGFCAEGFRRALVYEFLPNDSLEKFIFKTGPKKKRLGRQKLLDIALGIAKGIEYLHQGCDQQILHFDIKPHNILLDHNMNPKICDFGLAKLCSKEQSNVTMTAARGTMGYIAPEVLSRAFGRASYKSDVYSFGMMLLEMVGGRKNIDSNVNTSQVYFPQWIYNHLNLGEDFWAQIEGDDDDGNIARRLGIVGLWCIQWSPSDRPSMKVVVQMLEGDEGSLEVPPNPFPATNAMSSVAGVRGRRYEMELPLILESE